MKSKNPKKTGLVQVDWNDSCFWKEGWDDIEEVIKAFREGGMEPMQSVGYLLDETKDYVLICQSLHLNTDKRTVSRASEFFVIPRGCITKITAL